MKYAVILSAENLAAVHAALFTIVTAAAAQKDEAAFLRCMEALEALREAKPIK